MTTIMDRINAEITQDAINDEPCGCIACDNGVQSGHFACSQPSAAMLKAESEGLVVRHYTDEQLDGSRGLASAWRWFAV